MYAPYLIFEGMRNKFRCLELRDQISYLMCILAFVFGMILSIAGLIIEPKGEIHPSVITTVGMFLAFTGSVLGIGLHYSMELDKFKSEIKKDKHVSDN